MPRQDAPWGNILRQSVKLAKSAPLITAGFSRFVVIIVDAADAVLLLKVFRLRGKKLGRDRAWFSDGCNKMHGVL